MKYLIKKSNSQISEFDNGILCIEAADTKISLREKVAFITTADNSLLDYLFDFVKFEHQPWIIVRFKSVDEIIKFMEKYQAALLDNQKIDLWDYDVEICI